MIPMVKSAPSIQVVPQPISYRVHPSNYYTLSEDERTIKLRGFVQIVSRIRERVDIMISAHPVSVDNVPYVEKQVHITSTQDMGDAISDAGFRAVRLDTPYTVEPEDISMHHVLIQGAPCRIYAIHSMSRSITPAWINGIFEMCGFVIVRLWPVQPARARRMLLSHANVTGARRGRLHDQESQQADMVRELIEKEESSLVECALIAVVRGQDHKDLERRCQDFEANATWRQVRCTSIRGMQKTLLRGNGHRFLFELGSCAVFYPFESANMIESGGVYLGVNTINNTPVIYDYLRRVNSNVTFVGESGRGKSTTAKMYISNFLSTAGIRYGQNHRVMLYIIDPHGEYATLADSLGATVRDLESRDPMGLDPFKIFESGSKAAAILADASGMPASTRSVAISLANRCGSVSEFVKRLTSVKGPHKDEAVRAASYLLQFVQGDTAQLFDGKGDDMDRIVYTMRKADKTALNAMMVSMVMARVWWYMRQAPRHIPKLFVIDEGWFVTSMESTGQILEDVARSGRKENVHLLFLSQEPADILDNPYGQAVLNNSATIVLFGLKADLARKLQGVLRLSDTERDQIEGLDRGHALIRADDHRIRLHIKPTAAQLKRFNTAPAVRTWQMNHNIS